MALGAFAFFIMGIVLGLVGGGGSILTVPILVYLYGMNAQEATGSSLFVVGAAALIGSMAAFFKKELRFSQSLPFALPSLFGVFISRSFLLPLLPDPVMSIHSLTISKDLLLMVLFALLMLMASIKMIRAPVKMTEIKSSSLVLVAGQGFLVGVVTGFIGAGGGFLIIPALVFFLGLSMREAVGTSLMIIAMNSSIGFLGDLWIRPDKNWQLLLSAVAMAVVGLFVGRRLSPYFSEKNLKKIFGWVVLILGSLILWEQLF